MSTEQRFDLSSEAIPSSWHDAATEAPGGSSGPLRKDGPMRAMPTGKSFDAFTAVLTALVTCLIGGYLWYELEVSTGTPYPWVAIPFGAAIALAIRFGGGEPDHQVRAVMSVLFYAGATIATLFLIGRVNYTEFYGRTAGWLDFEAQLFSTRFTGAGPLISLALGALTSIAVSTVLRRRH